MKRIKEYYIATYYTAMKKIKLTNTLLLIIVIPLIFYLLKVLSFIFIPLVLSMFIALLFLPLMRWLKKKNVPKLLSILVVLLIIALFLKIGGKLIQLSSKEIVSSKSIIFERVESTLASTLVSIEKFFGIERQEGETVMSRYFDGNYNLKNLGSAFGFIRSTLSTLLLTLFFVILFLAESINFQHLMHNTLFKIKYSSVKTFMKIEKDTIKFIKVKFLLSVLTGIGFSLACVIFDVGFPIFWGLITFTINFIQLIGSVVSTSLLSLFALAEIESTGTLVLFIFIIIAVQVIIGGILEPVFMGRTFSINVITIVVMLMLWGFIWGIPGLLMSVPITVFLKIVLEQFPNTKPIAVLMAGNNKFLQKRIK